jgi:hypothetical protein
MAPIASALKAAARREFSLNVSRLNIATPLSDFFALIRRVVNGISTGQRFQDVCAKAAKRFRRGKELFRRGFARTQS